MPLNLFGGARRRRVLEDLAPPLPAILEEHRPATVERPIPGPRDRLIFLATIGSTALVGVFFRTTNIAPMLPRPVLALGAAAFLSVAVVGRLVWAPIFRGRLFHVLTWIGVCWAVLAAL